MTLVGVMLLFSSNFILWGLRIADGVLCKTTYWAGVAAVREQNWSNDWRIDPWFVFYTHTLLKWSFSSASTSGTELPKWKHSA